MTVAPTRSRRIPPEDEAHYPSGDGKPMAENDLCRELAIYCTDTLGHRYAHDPMVYVAGNNFIYFRNGHPRQCISPDVYVVFGVEKRLRKSYMSWHENGIMPAVVIEITSASTWAEDTRKRSRYEKMGVTEYFQFDPAADYLYPPLQGLRLVDGRYRKIEATTSPLLDTIPARYDVARHRSSPLCLCSDVLGLYLVQEGDRMRFYDATSGAPLLSGQERAEVEARRADAEAQRAAAEARRADAEAQRAAAEAQRADAEARRAGVEAQSAEAERRRAEAESQARSSAERRAEAETETRLQMQAEVARLRAELEELRHREDHR